MCEIIIIIKKMNTPKSSRVNCLVVSYPLQLVDYSPPGSSVHRILQARIQEWVAISYSRGPSSPRDLLHCRQVLYHLSHQGSPWIYLSPLQSSNSLQPSRTLQYPCLLKLLVCSLSLYICLNFLEYCENEVMQYVYIFCLGYFTQDNYFRIYLYCMHQSFILFIV